MYLTDEELRRRLDELRFESEDRSNPFDPDEQIGPCSVDLRLSRVYWKYRTGFGGRAKTLNLARAKLQELQPRRQWQRYELGDHEFLTIKPREMVIARIAEQMTMPADCAGAVEGRSSYARLGLAVHVSGGFINPGYSGHMPLTLYNHSPATLQIPVYAAICQLMVVKLDGSPSLSYAQRDAIYQNDDGGPSYWWRHRSFRVIVDRAGAGIGDQVLNRLDELLAGALDDAMLDRFERFVGRSRQHQYGNADELLDSFAQREDRYRIARVVGRVVSGGAGLGALLTLLELLASGASWRWVALLVVLALVGLGLELYLRMHPPGLILGRDELTKLRRQLDRTRTQSPKARDRGS